MCLCVIVVSDLPLLRVYCFVVLSSGFGCCLDFCWWFVNGGLRAGFLVWLGVPALIDFGWG